MNTSFLCIPELLPRALPNLDSTPASLAQTCVPSCYCFSKTNSGRCYLLPLLFHCPCFHWSSLEGDAVSAMCTS